MANPNPWPTFPPTYSSSGTQQGHFINPPYNSYNLQPPLPPPSSAGCGYVPYNAAWPPPPPPPPPTPPHFAHLQQFPPPPLPTHREGQQFWSLPTNGSNYASGNELKSAQHSLPQYYSEEATSRNTFENRHVHDNEALYSSSYSMHAIEDNAQEEKTQRQKNQEVLNEFVKKVCKDHPLGETLTSQEKLNISTVQVMLTECLHLMNDLKDIKSNMCSSVNLNESMWNTYAVQASETKRRLQPLVMKLNQVDVRNLEIYMKKRHRKRERIKRQKLRQNEERHEKEQQTKHLHEKIDAWQETIRHSHLAAEMEKKLKKEADGILSVVRRKCAEANRMLETVKSVSKLRALKKQAAANKGLFTTSESDESFSSTILKLDNLLTARLAEYAEEEKTLQVMLDEEHQVTRDSVVKIRQQEQNEKLEVAKQQNTFWLFGPEATINDMDPRYLYREYYTRPERNLDALVQVRQSWDIWLVPPATPESSGIPLTWVVPTTPSSSAWASYLGKQLP